MKSLLFTLSLFFFLSLLSAQDPCFNYGFEDGLNGYGGESGIFGNQATSCDLESVGFSGNSNFPASIDFVLESGGIDPHVTVAEIRRVHDGNASVRINDDQVAFNIDKLTKTFTVPAGGDYDFYFWYALVMENPAGHEDKQPFFEVNVCPAVGSCSAPIVSACIVSDATNTGQFGVQPNLGSTIVYQDWQCQKLVIPAQYAGTDVTVEFIAADCGAGAHWGYIYLDDLCVPCGSVPVGTVTLNEIGQPCEQTLPVTVSGTFTLPEVGGQVGTLSQNDLNLAITESGQNVTVGTVPLTSFDLAAGEFSFQIDASHLSGSGCFDVYVTAEFQFGGQTLPVVTSFSANPNVPGDVDNDFCSSLAACVCSTPSAILTGDSKFGTCIPGSIGDQDYYGTFNIPLQEPGGIPGTVEDITVFLYESGGTTPVAGPITGTITSNTQFYVNIDFTSLPPGCYDAQVIGNFTCVGEDIQSEYWAFNLFCWNSLDCINPTLTIDPLDEICDNLPLKVCGTYTPFTVAGITGGAPEMYMFIRSSNNMIHLIYDFEIDEVAHTFCFEIEDDPYFDTSTPCYRVYIQSTFTAPEDQTYQIQANTGNAEDFCLDNSGCSDCLVTVREECTADGNVQLTAIGSDDLPINPHIFLHELKWSVYANPANQGVTINNTNPIIVNANSCYKLTYNFWVYPDDAPWQTPGLQDSICTYVTPYKCLDLECEGPCADFPQFILGSCNDDYSTLYHLQFPEGQCNDICDGYGTVGIFNLDGTPMDPTGYTISWSNGGTGVYTNGYSFTGITVTIQLTEFPECSWTARYRPKCLCNNEPTHLTCEQRIIKHCQGETVTYTMDKLRLKWNAIPGAGGYEIEFTFDGLEECCGETANTPPYTVTSSLNFMNIDDLECFRARVKATGGLEGCEETEWSEYYEFCLADAVCDTVQVVCGCCGGQEGHPIHEDHEVMHWDETNGLEGSFGATNPGLNDSSRSTQGFAAYPNPVSNELTVELPDGKGEMMSLELFDIYQRSVRSLRLTGDRTNNIQLSGLPEGLYILIIKNQQGNLLYTDKIFKLK